MSGLKLNLCVKIDLQIRGCEPGDAHVNSCGTLGGVSNLAFRWDETKCQPGDAQINSCGTLGVSNLAFRWDETKCQPIKIYY